MSFNVPWFLANPKSGLLLEELVSAVYRNVVRPGMTVVDGGAHLGVHTFPLADLVGSEGIVLAFEPIKKMAEDLSERVHERQIHQVKVINKALSDKVGMVGFAHVVGDPGYSGLKERPNIPRNPEVQTVLVETDRLDESVLEYAEDRIVSFMKLDLEGGEFHSLKGAPTILSQHRPIVVFENGRQNAANLYGYTREDWFALFRGHNYELTDIFGRAFTEAEWSASPLPWYSIAIPFGDERKEQIIEKIQERALELA